MPDPSVTVVPAPLERADEILGAYEWLFAPPGAPPPAWDPDGAARARLESAITSPRAVVLVAMRTGKVVGFCTAYIDIESVRFGRRCWVEDLAVDPQARSRGIGAALLGEARSWAREQGASHLELDSAEARRDAHRFYEREQPTWRSQQYSWVLT